MNTLNYEDPHYAFSLNLLLTRPRVHKFCSAPCFLTSTSPFSQCVSLMQYQEARPCFPVITVVVLMDLQLFRTRSVCSNNKLQCQVSRYRSVFWILCCIWDRIAQKRRESVQPFINSDASNSRRDLPCLF